MKPGPASTTTGLVPSGRTGQRFDSSSEQADRTGISTGQGGHAAQSTSRNSANICLNSGGGLRKRVLVLSITGSRKDEGLAGRPSIPRRFWGGFGPNLRAPHCPTPPCQDEGRFGLLRVVAPHVRELRVAAVRRDSDGRIGSDDNTGLTLARSPSKRAIRCTERQARRCV